MKITVVKKASTSKKPENYCPWFSEDSPQDVKK